MRPIIIDTEFTAFSAGAKIISVAFVDPVGCTQFYAEVDGWDVDECSDFVIDEVIPQLDPASRMTLEHAASAAREYLEGMGEPVVLISDSIAWEHNMLEQLFDGKWPSCVSPLMSQMIDVSEVADQIHFGSVDPFPHHALKDALALTPLLDDLVKSIVETKKVG